MLQFNLYLGVVHFVIFTSVSEGCTVYVRFVCLTKVWSDLMVGGGCPPTLTQERSSRVPATTGSRKFVWNIGRPAAPATLHQIVLVPV